MNRESRRHVVLAGYRRRSLLPAPWDAYLILKLVLNHPDKSNLSINFLFLGVLCPRNPTFIIEVAAIFKIYFLQWGQI